MTGDAGERMRPGRSWTALAAVLALIGCASVERRAPAGPPLAAEAAGDPLGPADLSVCTRTHRDLGRTPEVDVRDVARRLHGTWELKTRTIEGLTIPTHSGYYFDLDVDHATPVRATGTAMMLDAGNLGVLDVQSLTHECPKDACLGAFWTVTIERGDDGRSVRLVMKGDYVGSYAEFRDGVQATEEMTFLEKTGVYLSGGLTTPNGGAGEDVWDLVSLADGVFIYVSCKNAYVERYVKISGQRPLVEGASLDETWLKKKRTGELLDPSYGRSVR